MDISKVVQRRCILTLTEDMNSITNVIPNVVLIYILHYASQSYFGAISIYICCFSCHVEPFIVVVECVLFMCVSFCIMISYKEIRIYDEKCPHNGIVLCGTSHAVFYRWKVFHGEECPRDTVASG